MREKFRYVHESFVFANISCYEPNFTNNSLLINTAPSRKLLATIQFTTEESRNKVATNKGWFTVI
jgi:hypothetical protein